MHKRIGRLIGTTALAIMLAVMSVPTFATNDIDEAKKEKEKMEEQLKDTQSALEDLESVKSDTEAYIAKMDDYITNLTDNIYSLEASAQEKRQAIAVKETEIAQIESEIAEQYEAMKLRIKYMYENGEISYISMFFESQDMSDFLNRAEYLTEITEYDRDMLVKLQDNKNTLDIAKSNLDSELADLDALLKEAEEEKAAAEVLVSAKETELSSTNEDIVSKEEAIKRQQEEIEAQEQLIKELEEIERKRQEEAAANQTQQIYDGGKLMWPLPGYSNITSEFGNRIHPVTGIYSFHSGIDIGAPTGTQIMAAYDGEVAWSNYSGTAGNWIGIDHGNGLYTIYMHMSKRIANTGDIVKKGDVIGLVGSTGRSTGPHLHFSVRLNGSYVEPLNYVSP
ncbi:MAG: murein hydrolase activator EnvC family protein [Lachnospiraceae bacterium]